MFRLSLLVCIVILGFSSVAFAQGSKPLRAGIIGLDTSHVTQGLLNSPKAEGDLAGIRVVAAFPGGSPDVASSRDRIEGFTKTMREKYKVEIVDSIDDLLKKVDVVLIESVDGRPHLEQVKPVIKAGKPVFVDKPFAGSLADCVQIFDLAKKNKVPIFSSSSLRYYPGVQAVGKDPKLGKLTGCITYAPCAFEEHHPDLFWYGIHGTETLFTIMGTGCESVSRTHTKNTDEVTGVWKDGRIGTFRGLRNASTPYGAVAFGSKAVLNADTKGSYEPLVVEICKFFKTGKPPVSPEETLEIYAFMEAADESKRQGGAPVKIADVLAKARKQAAAAKK